MLVFLGGSKKYNLGGALRYVWVLARLGEMIHFDKYIFQIKWVESNNQY